MNPIFYTDGYKLGHRQQYPEGIEAVYATFIPRDNRYYKEADKVISFGLQYFIKEYFLDQFENKFFKVPLEKVLTGWNRRINTFLGPDNTVGDTHIKALHDLGYLPLEIKALPEGTASPIGVPLFSIVNTHPDFFWLTNHLETILSAVMWMPITSATSSFLFKKELVRHAKKVGWTADLTELGFNMHDFSMRGMPGLEASIVSALGHIACFNGTETIPALEAAEKYYNINAEKELLAGTVPATEHSVMSASGDADELGTYRRLLQDIYPNGIVSIVSDTYDYETVVTKYIPRLKDIIEARDGRFVVRPDSGDPVDIIAGFAEGDTRDTTEFYRRGTYETLWDIFGGTVNEAGYKVLNTKIGIIYGDAITLERQAEIYRRLEVKGFAATNLVLGIGSYTFQGKTRDSLGQALKTSAVKINGEWKNVFKDPKTFGQGISKKSLVGFAKVVELEGVFSVIDKVPFEENGGCMVTVFKDGKLIVDDTLTNIRGRIDNEILKTV